MSSCRGTYLSKGAALLLLCYMVSFWTKKISSQMSVIKLSREPGRLLLHHGSPYY